MSDRAEPTEIAHLQFQGRHAARLFGVPSGAADANDLVLRMTGDDGPLRVSKCGGDPGALGAGIELSERVVADNAHWYWVSVSGTPPDAAFILRRVRKGGEAVEDIARIEAPRRGLPADAYPVLSLDDRWLYWTVPGYRSSESAAFSGGGVYRTNKDGSGDLGPR